MAGFAAAAALQSIPLIGDAIGSIVQARQSGKNVRDTIRHQKEMAEYAYGKDLQMWERSNLYNAPTQQMARLRAAGLNPNLVYGKGATATSSAQLPKYQAPRPDYSQRQNPMQALGALRAFQDVRLQSAQIDNVKQEAGIKSAEKDIKQIYRDWMFTKTASAVKGKTVTMRPNWAQLYETQLSTRKAELQQKRIGLDRAGVDLGIRRLEKDWYETLKRSGIVGQLGLPMLKLLLK